MTTSYEQYTTSLESSDPTTEMQKRNESPSESFSDLTAKQRQMIVDWTKKQFESMKTARSMTERTWMMNLAFYFGKQNVVFKQGPYAILGSSGSLYVPPAPYYRARPVINRVRSTVRTDLSRLTSQKPTATIVPASSDDIDLFAAQAGEQIWDTTYRMSKFRAKLRRTMFWTLTCGTGFMKNYWDADAIDPNSNQMGNFVFRPETPFHVFVPDLREEELEEQPYIIHAQFKHADQLAMMFPGHRFNTSGRKTGRGEILDDAWINLFGASSSFDESTILCLEVWVKPGAVRMFPHGAMFTVIGDQLVQGVEGWPYIHRMYPFAKFEYIPSGKFYSDSIIVDLVPLQREYNRTRGQIIEAKNRMAKPRLMAARGSVDPNKITTEPGQVILYTPGYDPPTPLPMDELPNYVIQEQDRILFDWGDIAGQHEVTQGQVPPGVTAATAISFLQEKDESKLSPTFGSLEEGVEKISRMTLSYVSQFWTTERAVRVVGTDNSFAVLAFKGSDLRGNTDIRIESGSALPTSKAAKQAFIMDLMKMGFIDPMDGLEVMEIGGITKIYEKIQVDVRQAQRENLRMAQVNDEMIQFHAQQVMADMDSDPDKYVDPVTRQPKTPVGPDGVPRMPLIVPVNVWDNHRMHVELHNKYRKSQSFEMANDAVRQTFDEHVKMHVEQIMVGQFAQVPPDVLAQMNAEMGTDLSSQEGYKENEENTEQLVEEEEGPQRPASTEGGST